MSQMNLSSFLSTSAGQMPLGMRMSAALAFSGADTPQTYAQLSTVAEDLASQYGASAFTAGTFEHDRELGARAFARSMEPHFNAGLILASLKSDPLEFAHREQLFDVDYGAMLSTGLLSYHGVQTFLEAVEKISRRGPKDVKLWVERLRARMETAGKKFACASMPAESAGKLIKRVVQGHSSHFNEVMSSVYQGLDNRKNRSIYLTAIDDSDFPRLLDAVFNELLEEMKIPQKRRTGTERAAITALRQLFQLVDVAKAAGHSISFAEEDRYAAARQKYQISGGSRSSEVNAGTTSLYRVTAPISPYEVFITNGYVRIGSAGGKKLEIRIGDFRRDVEVEVRIGGDDAGFICFRRVGKGFDEKYMPGNPLSIRKRFCGEAIINAIAECFERGCRRAKGRNERYRV